MQLTKGPTGFRGSVELPWNVKIAYKFIVDGQWMLVEHEPTEPDHDGNLNNVYTAPPKPPSHASETDPVVVTGTKTASHPTDSSDATVEPEVASEIPKMITDLANTVAAREGTTSASVGTDPINAEQVIIECIEHVPRLTLWYLDRYSFSQARYTASRRRGTGVNPCSECRRS
jgi:hypothetical protein